MGEGYKAKGPRLRTQASDVRWGSDVRKLGTVWTSGSLRTSVNIVLSPWHRSSGRCRSSVRWDLSDVRVRRSSGRCSFRRLDFWAGWSSRRRTSGVVRSSGGCRSSVVRPLGTPQLRLLPSSLPCFPRGWCSYSLALALLLLVREAPAIPMHAHGRSVK